MSIQKLSTASGARYGALGMNWATVTGGTVTTVTNSDGSVDEVHTFTANGTLTVVKPGYARVLVVGAGANGTSGYGGGGGFVIPGIIALPAGSHAVTVGVPDPNAGTPSFSSIGSIISPARGGFQLGTAIANYTDDISGTAVVYSGPHGGAAPGTPTASGGSTAKNGIVIVRVRLNEALPPPPTGPWAVVTGGTVTEYTKPDGAVMEVHTFTAAGSLTVVAAGYADVLVVGAGGSGGSNGRGGGGGGEVLSLGLRPLAVGTIAATIGVSVPANGQTPAGSTTFGAVTARGGSAGDDPIGGWKYQTGDNASGTGAEAGITSAISGTAVVYGAGGATQNLVGPANTGQGGGWTAAGGANPIGGSGVVIVAVQKTPPTVSGVVASGGTETTYTGDGVNGVLGQNYKVHTFTADGSFVVTQGGECDVLVVAGGQAQKTVPFTYNGGSGSMIRARVIVKAGSVPITVGVGDTDGGSPQVSGAFSRFADILAAGGNQGFEAGTAKGVAATAGVVDAISGSSVAYAKADVSSSTPGSGGVAGDSNGKAGIVIVRYEI